MPEPRKLSELSEKSRDHILKFFEDAERDVNEVLAEDFLPIETPTQETPMTHQRDAYALRDADEIIAALAAQGHGDYSAHRDAIADLWDGEYGLWQGNDTATTDLEDPDLRDIMLIQEDHFDQHMDDDDKPSEDDSVGYFGGYVYLA